jgi:hypothetical protein
MTDSDADILPAGINSVKCVGKLLPNPTQNKIIPTNVTVPIGKVIANKDKEARRPHNEFIVYNTNQVKMKYLCMVKFD